MPVFLQGRRAFFIIPAPPTSPRPLLIRSPRLACSCLAYPRRTCPVAAACHSYPSSSTPLPPSVVPTLPRLPRCRHLSLLPSPRLPRCRLSLLPSPRLPRCRRLRIPKRRTARTSPVRSEQPHDPRPFSHPAQGSATARVPFAVLPGAPVPAPEAQKKADGTAQRPVRRQKATNLSRQHHRGSSSTRQVSALA